MSLRQKAFTLVELAIVITIIGLLIGGVLKGQELLENARMTSLGAQVKSYTAADTTFRDLYKGRAGDLASARNFITGCTAANNCVNGNGDNVIGTDNVDWWWAFGPTEHFQYWKQMALAGLITGVDTTIAQSAAYNGGREVPASTLGGQVYAKTTVGGSTVYTGMTGGMLVFVSGNQVGYWNGLGLFTPSLAQKVDLKLDDGKALSGEVLGTSSDFISGCGTTANGTNGYNVNTSGKVCDMGFTIGS